MDTSKLIKSLGHSQGLVLAPHIDHYLERFPEFAPTLKIGGVKVDDGHFHPSSHCLLDEEALFKDRLKPTREVITASQKKTFDTGHFWHGYIQAALVEMNFVAQENVERHGLWPIPGVPSSCGVRGCTRLDHGLKISGTVDLLDVEIPGRGVWLVDIKTTSSSTFDSLEKTSLYSKYVAQVNVYGDCSERDKMLILVIEKDSPHRFREIQIQRDPYLLAEIYTRWGRVSERLHTNKLQEVLREVKEKLE